MLEFLLKRRRIIVLIVLPLLVAGIFSLTKMPVKLYPNMKKPTIQITISHPSYTAEDFYYEYRDTLEPILNAIEGVDHIESTYSSGRTRFSIEFVWDTSYDDAKALVESAMSGLKSSLPEESEDYYISSGGQKAGSGFMTIAVYSEEIPAKELFEMVRPALKNRLNSVKDAESIDIINTEELNAEIILRPEALLTYALTPDTVAQAVKSGYKNISIGSFRENRNAYNLRVKNGINSLFDIEDILITTKGNKEILLKDIADVKVYYGLPGSLFSANGERSIMIYAVPKEDGNLKNMSEDIKQILAEVQKELPGNIKFELLVDPSVFINKAVSNVVTAAIVGSLLAIIVIIIFLGEWRNTLIISLSIPLTMVLTFILMYGFGITVNLISLSGMTLAVGMVVDSSVVIMENIHRHRTDNPEEPITVTIKNAVNEVKFAVIGSTITSICVFFPLSFTAPLTNAILGDLAKTIIFALTCSIFTALIITPIIAYYLFRNVKPGAEKKSVLIKFSEKITGNMIEFYANVLSKILYSKKKSLLILSSSFIALILLVIFVFPKIRKEIIADPKSDRIGIRFTKNESLDKEELLETFLPYEKKILDKLGDKAVNRYSNIFSTTSGMLIIALKNSKYIDEALDDAKDILQNSDEWTFDTFAWDPSKMPLPRTYGLHLKIAGKDKQVVVGLMEEIMDVINKQNLYRSVSSVPSNRPTNEILLIPRKEVIKEFPELSVTKLSNIIKILLNGSQVIRMNEDDSEITVYLEYQSELSSSIENIMDFQIPYKNKSIPLKHFFDYETKKGISEIRNNDGEETFNIYGFMNRGTPDYKKKDFEAIIRSKIKSEIDIPDGYVITFVDTQEVINESVYSLVSALIISIFLVYLVLGLQFNSLRIPLVILVTIPLGFIGVIGSLFVSNSTISLNSMLGTILLGGIVVNNAIIILDFYIVYRNNKLSKIETLITIAKLRFTPILITTATTLLGMLPIALAIGDGTNIIQPLGISVSGGLTVSTIFTLIIIPVIINILPDSIFLKNNE